MSSRFHQRASQMMDELPPDISNDEVIRRFKMVNHKKSPAPPFHPPAKRKSVKRESRSRKSIKREKTPYREGEDDDVVYIKTMTEEDRRELAKKDAVDLVIADSAIKSPPTGKDEKLEELLKLHNEVLDIKNKFNSTMNNKDDRIKELEKQLSNVQDENMKHLLRVSKLTRENMELITSFPVTPDYAGGFRIVRAKPLFYPPTRDPHGTTRKSLNFSTAKLNKKRRKKKTKKRKSKKQKGGADNSEGRMLGLGAAATGMLASEGIDPYMFPAGLAAGYAVGGLGQSFIEKKLKHRQEKLDRVERVLQAAQASRAAQGGGL